MFDRIVDNRTILERSRTKRVLIADAGQIYRMDYAALIQEHCDNAADITVAVISESQSHSTQRPIVLVDQNESRPDRILKITNSGVASR
jgi:glucose-1-phosphate adenylyltransferase